MQKGNILTVYKDVSAIALGDADRKRYRKRVKGILCFRKLPFQECTNMYPYVPFCSGPFSFCQTFAPCKTV
jgi:hypothetical protein